MHLWRLLNCYYCVWHYAETLSFLSKSYDHGRTRYTSFRTHYK